MHKDPKLSKEKVAKRVSKIADEPMPQHPLQSHHEVPHSYVEHLLNHSAAQAFGYGMIPRDMAGSRLIHASHGPAK